MEIGITLLIHDYKYVISLQLLSSRNLLKEIEISKASIEALKFEYSDIYKIINKDIVQNKCRITATAFFFYHNLLNCGKNNLQECEK
ncbi:MAG: hypothetical protein L6407_00100 [Candidatus Delongbacteria bacterium]|nr:hypothetical protein [Candidatus Delongbacteria bacterium]